MREKINSFYHSILLVFICMVCACQKNISPNISTTPTIPSEDPIIIEVNWTEDVYADLLQESGTLKGPEIVLNKETDYNSWRSAMSDLGKNIWNSLNDNDIDFTSSQSVIDSFRNLGIPSNQLGLFNEYIRPITNIDELIIEMERKLWDVSSDTPKNFLSEFSQGKNSNGRDHLTAIVALQHYLEYEVKALVPDAYEKRRSTVIDNADKIQRLYLSYIYNVNKSHGFNISDIDLNNDSIKTLYQKIAKVKAGLTIDSSSLAYRRTKNQSSHLKQKDLINPKQFGIDMRFSSSVNAVNILPSKSQHLLLGFFQFPDNDEVKLFYKQEGHGLGKVSDFVSHMMAWRKHNKSGSANKGYRETIPSDKGLNFLNKINEQAVFEKTGVKPSGVSKNKSLASIVAQFNDEQLLIESSDKNDILQRIGNEVKLNTQEFLPSYEAYLSDFKKVTSPNNFPPVEQFQSNKTMKTPTTSQNRLLMKNNIQVQYDNATRSRQSRMGGVR